ncbi:MAG: hypothetical protein SW833_21255 [Cyanobacteriota bacterium]|nr:hypothetical protein [Cyanobacteriota bacterium]
MVRKHSAISRQPSAWVSIQPSAVSHQLKINLERENWRLRNFRELKVWEKAHQLTLSIELKTES